MVFLPTAVPVGLTELVSGSGPKLDCRSQTMSRVIGPGVSSVGLSGRTPNVLIRPIVVFSPVTPFHAAGMRTDPPVSVPIAQGATRAATATPEPAVRAVVIGELHRVGFAEVDNAGGQQFADECRCVRRKAVPPSGRAAHCDLAGRPQGSHSPGPRCCNRCLH
jgi:hypothetical protein